MLLATVIAVVSCLVVAGLMDWAHALLLVDEKEFANNVLAAVNGLRRVYEVNDVSPADDALNQKAKELSAMGDLKSISSHLKDHRSDYSDFSVNIAEIQPTCAARITPKQLVTTFAILAGTNDWPCASTSELFGGAREFWTPPDDIPRVRAISEMTIRSEGFWPFIMEKRGQAVAVGFTKTPERTVVVLLFNSWKTVALPNGYGRLVTPFKFDVMTRKATAGCVSVAPQEALNRLCTEPKAPTGRDKSTQLLCKPITEKLLRDLTFLKQCKAYRTYNQSFAKCVDNGLRHGFGGVYGRMTKIILNNACDGGLNALPEFFMNAAESRALGTKEE